MPGVLLLLRLGRFLINAGEFHDLTATAEDANVGNSAAVMLEGKARFAGFLAAGSANCMACRGVLAQAFEVLRRFGLRDDGNAKLPVFIGGRHRGEGLE